MTWRRNAQIYLIVYCINWDKEDDVGMDTDLDAELDSDQDYEMDDEEGLESMRTMATEMSCDDLEWLPLTKLDCRGRRKVSFGPSG